MVEDRTACFLSSGSPFTYIFNAVNKSFCDFLRERSVILTRYPDRYTHTQAFYSYCYFSFHNNIPFLSLSNIFPQLIESLSNFYSHPFLPDYFLFIYFLATTCKYKKNSCTHLQLKKKKKLLQTNRRIYVLHFFKNLRSNSLYI